MTMHFNTSGKHEVDPRMNLPASALAKFKDAHLQMVAAIRAKPTSEVLLEQCNGRGQAFVLVACHCDRPDCTGLLLGICDIFHGQSYFYPSKADAAALAVAFATWGAE